MKRAFLATLVLFLLTSVNAVAQCSMCKAVAQTGSDNGESVAGGLNDAILYLMAVPYLLLLIFFRKRLWNFIKEIRSMWA